MKGRRLYWSEAIMLMTVVAPLALAEGVWWYWAATVLSVVCGWLTTVRRDRPLIGPAAGRVFVVAAFCFLLIEYEWVTSVPAVMALSHFMILVCICKLVQRRTFRDDAQVLVLSMLLLVVAAIVSGNLMFPAVLAVYLTVGLEALIRFHLAVEAARVGQGNRELHPSAADGGAEAPGRWARAGVSLLTGLVSVAVGAAIFILCPRVGAGMFGRFEAADGGHAVSGFVNTLNFHTIGPIKESDRPVMRVKIESEGGPDLPADTPLLFRGAVLDQYLYRLPLSKGGWGWARADRGDSHWEEVTLRVPDALDHGVLLLPEYDPTYARPALIQRYYLEPGRQLNLFTCYPPVEIGSRDLKRVRKRVYDQVLRVDKESGKLVSYTVSSPLGRPPALVEALAEERAAHGPAAEVRALQPDPPLPREAEIRDLIHEWTGRVGPLDEPKSRLEFSRRIQDRLRSGEFTYTLNPPPVPHQAEPIGEFLLSRRRGHCEYFASAMAVMCQLSGIPARVVSGYRAGDYNPIGEFYVVREKHAHSWVEVFITGMDWVTFDPTPARTAGQAGAGRWLMGLSRYLDYLQFLWVNLVVSYDADLRREVFQKFEAWLARPARNQPTVLGAVTAFVRELFGGRLKLTLAERLVYWVFSLLVVALVVLIGYVVVLAWRQVSGFLRLRLGRSATKGHGPEVEFYHRFCRRLAAFGLRRRADQTPAEFAEELAGRHPMLDQGPELVWAYYEVAFGGRRLSPARQLRIEAFLQRLRRSERQAGGESTG